MITYVNTFSTTQDIIIWNQMYLILTQILMKLHISLMVVLITFTANYKCSVQVLKLCNFVALILDLWPTKLTFKITKYVMNYLVEWTLKVQIIRLGFSSNNATSKNVQLFQDLLSDTRSSTAYQYMFIIKLIFSLFCENQLIHRLCS